MFLELDDERTTGGGKIFINMDRVSTAHLSADGKTLMVSFASGDHHPFKGEENVNKLLAVLRPSA